MFARYGLKLKYKTMNLTRNKLYESKERYLEATKKDFQAKNSQEPKLKM